MSLPWLHLEDMMGHKIFRKFVENVDTDFCPALESSYTLLSFQRDLLSIIYEVNRVRNALFLLTRRCYRNRNSMTREDFIYSLSHPGLKFLTLWTLKVFRWFTVMREGVE